MVIAGFVKTNPILKILFLTFAAQREENDWGAKELTFP